MKPRIAMLSSGKVSVPSEQSIFAPGTVIFNITEELVQRNYQITLFSSKDSQTSAKLEHLNFNSIHHDYSHIYHGNPRKYFFYETQYELMLITRAVEEANKGYFDIIHAHDFRIVPYFSKFCRVPILFTYHGSIRDDMAHPFNKARTQYYHDFCYFVSITDFQRKEALEYANVVSTVHHGIDKKKFLFSEKSKNHMLFLGRLVEFKAPHLAAEVAKQTGKKIFIGGDKGLGSKDQIYWEQYIEPILGQKYVKYLGHVPYSTIQNEYRQAKTLIVPIQWDEPFGLVMIEAMACGTPVVAFDRGAVREILKDGETGFIVPPDDINAMAGAVKKIYEMPKEEYKKMRQNCRKHVEENFTIKKMVDGYEKVYEKVIADWREHQA